MKNVLLFLTLTFLTAQFKTNDPIASYTKESDSKLSYKPAAEKTKEIDVFGADFTNLEFKSIELVPIETSANALVGKFSQIIIEQDKDNFYISNSVNNPEIFRFNKAGEFLGTIGHYGGGPKEFSSIEDISIHGDTVDVLCGMGDKVKVVGYKNDGTFLYTRPIELNAYSFEWTSPGYILETSYSKAYPYRTYTSDVKGKVTGKYLPNTTGFAMALVGKYFEKVGSNVYRHESYDNEVQVAEGSDFQTSYNLDLGAFTVPDEYFKSQPVQAFQLLQKRAYAIILKYFETPSYSFFSIRQKPKSTSGLKDYIDQIIVLDKPADKLYKRSFKMQSEDFFKHPVTGTIDNELVFLIYPYMILSDKEAFKKLAITNPEIIDRLEVDDNPVLAICKM